MHVVVVDDEHRMVELIASYLDDQHVTTIGCFDGPSGLAAARGPDVGHRKVRPPKVGPRPPEV